MDAIRDRIICYMNERLGLNESEIIAIRHDSLQKYGTTLLGLKERYDIDENEYLDYVHNINLAEYLKKNKDLELLLKSYSQRKIIFTNGDRKHVDRILKYLEISDYFDEIIDIHILMPFLKPHKEAFDKALKIAKISSWNGCAFLDDHPANIEQARKLGIYSILIDEKSQFQDNLKITSLIELPTLIPF